MEILRDDPETETETTLETGLEQAETKPETSPETQDALTASKVNQVFRFKAQGRTYRDIASETGLSLATVSRMLKDLPEVAVKDSAPVLKPEAVQISSEPLLTTKTEAVPVGFTLSPSLSASEWSELNSLPKNKLIALAGELKAKEKLQSQNIVQRHNGNGDSHEANRLSRGEDEFWFQMAEIAKIKKAKLAEDIFSTDKRAETSSSDVRTILEVIKTFAPKPTSELELYKTASEDTRKNLETLMKKEASNDFDVKLEELRQNREIDLKKIDFEIQKWHHSNDDGDKKWGLVEKLASGPIGSAISSMGNATALRLSRGRKNPQVTRISCPNCNNQTFLDASAETAPCGVCGSLLARQAKSPGPQTPEPEQSSAQTPQAVQTPEEKLQVEEEKSERGEADATF